jgi:hypothetical protein
MDSNVTEGVVFVQPKAANDRAGVANACAVGLKLTVPILVDDMNNSADIAFNGWPERLYVLSEDGKVAYQGGKGPYDFKPEELADFLAGYTKGSQEQ